MRRLLLFITTFFLLLGFCDAATAQNDTARIKSGDTLRVKVNTQNNIRDDDEFSLFLLTFAVAGFGAMAGAMIICSIFAALAILLCVLFVSVGIISASLLAAFYKRSVSAGFKTFVVIICAIGCAIIGSTGLFLFAKIFSLNLSSQLAFLFGSLGGIAGGILMGLVTYKSICYLMIFVKKKLRIL